MGFCAACLAISHIQLPTMRGEEGGEWRGPGLCRTLFAGRMTCGRQKRICPGVIHCRVADGWERHFATVGPAKKESGETKFPTRPLIVARTNLRSFQKTFGAYCIQPGSCPPRKRQDGLRGHINQTLLFPTTNKAIQHSAPKVFLKNTPPPPSTVLWAGFLIVWRTPRPYGAESVLEVLQGSVAGNGETAFPTWGARPLMVAPSDKIFLTGGGTTPDSR